MSMRQVSPQYLLSPTASLSTRRLGSSSSGSRPAGPGQREDTLVNGLAWCLAHFSLGASEPEPDVQGTQGLGFTSGNCCRSLSSSRKRICMLLAGWALTALRVLEMAPAGSPGGSHIRPTQPGTERSRGSLLITYFFQICSSDIPNPKQNPSPCGATSSPTPLKLVYLKTRHLPAGGERECQFVTPKAVEKTPWAGTRFGDKAQNRPAR